MLRAFQWDLARQVERLDVLLDLLPRYADWGYQELYLHLEDAVDYPSLPGVARRDAYPWRQFEKLVARATQVGIGVVPIVNLLGHTQYLIKTPAWRDLNEVRLPNGDPAPLGQICPHHPRLPDLVSRLLRDVRPLCTAGKIHLGLDESYLLGRCPRCREEVEQLGLGRHFAGHVQRLHAQVAPTGLRFGLWADMLALFPEAIPHLPRGLIAYDWYYYPFPRQPRIELYGFRPYDLEPALRRQGISYWGCAMNGSFRFEPLPVFSDRLANAASWWQRCQSVNAEGFLSTSWEPNRLAFTLPTVVDAAIASLWLAPGVQDPADRLAHGFARVHGSRVGKPAAALALAADKYPYSGYYAWESHQRWDGGVTLEELPALEKVAAHFRSLTRWQVPEPLASSLLLRRYYADRDLFLGRSATLVRRLRQAHLRKNAPVFAALRQQGLAEAKGLGFALRRARRAARTLWLASRTASQPCPNLQLLREDLQRLRRWSRWLEACSVSDSFVFTANPIRGERHLQFHVRLLTPAIQRVTVESLRPEGSWELLAGRHTIEFQAFAAVSRLNLSRPFAVALPSRCTRVRVAVYGVGPVTIEGLALEVAGEVHPLQAEPITLGGRPPLSGLPNLSALQESYEFALPTFAPPSALPLS